MWISIFIASCSLSACLGVIAGMWLQRRLTFPEVIVLGAEALHSLPAEAKGKP